MFEVSIEISAVGVQDFNQQEHSCVMVLGSSKGGGTTGAMVAIAPLKFRSRELSPALCGHAGYEKIPI